MTQTVLLSAVTSLIVTVIVVLLVYVYNRIRGDRRDGSPLTQDQLWDTIRSLRGQITTLRDQKTALERRTTIMERDLTQAKETITKLQKIIIDNNIFHEE